MPVIIHTSDVHLGAPLGWLGPKAGEQREQLKRTLSKIVDLAIAQHADALVVAGDLFHSNNPSAAAVRFVLREFSRLTTETRARVVLLPGSHDSLDIESVYTSYRDEFARTEGVSVLGLDGLGSVKVESAGVTFHGNPTTAGRFASAPSTPMVPDPDSAFNVAVLHGRLEGSADGEPSATVRLSEFSDAGWSYAALGHRHGWHEVEGGPLPAVYPGSPELVSVDQDGQGYIARVELRASGAIVTKVRVGVRSVVEARVDVTGAPDSFSVAELVRQRALANPQAVLRLVLTGMRSAESGIDDGGLVEDLAADYFFVCPPVRDYHVKLSERDLAQLPERLVVGRFARHMRARLEEAASEEERREIEDALQLGVALLQGKDVVG